MDDITNIISLAISVTTFLFVVYHWRAYRYTIVIPFLMAVCSLTYSVIPIWINNILYDITLIVVSIMLVRERLHYKEAIPCDSCGYKPKRKDD